MIKVLSDDTIQKIAAGEVVERPASIVKELVENSIDANSKNILVEIRNGGKTYIKVSDDGHGIEKDDISLAFTRHATSKITDFDDLYKIYSMGFRGEALASIVSVSKIVMKTKTENGQIGNQVEYDNGKLISSKSIAMNKGTVLEVYDLFKFVPVRYKFMGTDMSEANKITQLMYSFAIGHPEISFTYIKDNRQIFSTSNKSDQLLNYEILFGDDFVKNSIDIEKKSNNFKITGKFSNNKYYKGNRSMQYIFVNGRYIENQQIVDAIESCYYNLIPNGRFPLFDLKIDVDPSLIDINIHPNKQKIKFSFAEELITVLKEELTHALFRSEQNKQIEEKIEKKPVNFHELNSGEGYKKILDAYKDSINYSSLKSSASTNSVKESKIELVPNNLIKFDEIGDDDDISEIFENNDSENLFDIQTSETESSVNENNLEQTKFIEQELNFKTILVNKYILFEDAEHSKFVLVDIQRANERILFDKISFDDSQLASQELIEPLIVELIAKDMEIFINNKDKFHELAFEIDQFSDTSIIIRSLPYFMDRVLSESDFIALLEDLDRVIESDRKNFILKSNISKSLHKSNNLSEEEAILLYDNLQKTDNPFTSPHGKSIVFELDFDTFIRMFK